MKLLKKHRSEDEGYWKSFTDIMAGLLMVILLVLMLLLLYMTQMNTETHQEDHEYDYSLPYIENYTHHEDHRSDEMYARPPQDGGGGGGGGGVDDPGTNDNAGVDNDYGHDKAAVHVTVIDEETKKPIKKEGIQFNLHTGGPSGKVRELNTYYPVKTTYKIFETTKDGTFYLPEKVPFRIYALHNLKAPKGYSFADDVTFTVSESRDWSQPYEITVPMSPSKSVIYVQGIDADTKKGLDGGSYEIYAEDDIVTLDGTVRFKAGDKVDAFKCDKTGKGNSKKLYFGKYSVVQKDAVKYYAVNEEPLSVDLNYLENKSKVYKIACKKTRVELTLLDEETKQPIPGAVYTVTGRENAKTDKNGRIVLTDFEKGSSVTMTLSSLPKPYRMIDKKLTIDVDAKGLINGGAVYETELTAYIIRLTVSAQDQLFGNEISNMEIRLYLGGVVVQEWTATGEQEVFEDLEPGEYTLEVNGDINNRQSIKLKDQPGKQVLQLTVWTTMDSLAIAGGALAAALIIALIIGLISSRRKKKLDEKE